MANEMTWGNQSGYLTNTKLNKEFRRVALAWGTGSVDEYGNAVPYTFKAQTLSKFQIEEILRTGLVDDYVKAIEGLVETQFFATPLKAYGTATGHLVLDTTGTFSDTNTGGLSAYHIRKMVLELKKRNVPGYTSLGGAYAGILSVEAGENVEGDMIDVKNVQYTETGLKQVLMNGEVGKIAGCRLIEDSFASRFVYDPVLRTTTAKFNSSTARPTGDLRNSPSVQAGSWTNTTGGLGGDAYIFGSPTVREAIVVPEEIRRKIPGDYGRSKGIAWYALLGFEIEWGDTEATNSDARIIHWSSL